MADEKQISLPRALAELNLNVDDSLRAPASDPSSLDDVARAIELRKQVEIHRGMFFVI